MMRRVTIKDDMLPTGACHFRWYSHLFNGQPLIYYRSINSISEQDCDALDFAISPGSLYGQFVMYHFRYVMEENGE